MFKGAYDNMSKITIFWWCPVVWYKVCTPLYSVMSQKTVLIFTTSRPPNLYHIHSIPSRKCWKQCMQTGWG